jgi:hypothetical protein
MFDKFALPGSPNIIRIDRLVDQFMGRVFKEGVTAARPKTNPE